MQPFKVQSSEMVRKKKDMHKQLQCRTEISVKGIMKYRKRKAKTLMVPCQLPYS